MKKIEAKPCPFCGWHIVEGIIDKRGRYQIRCKSCKAGTGWFKYWADAVTAWNRRADDKRDDG